MLLFRDVWSYALKKKRVVNDTDTKTPLRGFKNNVTVNYAAIGCFGKVNGSASAGKSHL